MPRGFAMVLPADADLSDLSPYVEELEERRRAYMRLKAEITALWRDKVLERDGHACRSCGAKAASDLLLHLAHITSAQAFNRYFGHPEGLRQSYRDDNLVILCRYCHSAEHGRIQLRLTAEQRAAHEKLVAMEGDPAVQRAGRLVRKWEAIIHANGETSVLSEHPVFREFQALVGTPTVAEYMSLGAQFGPAIEAEHRQAHERHQNVRALFHRLIADRQWKSVPSLVKKLGGEGLPPRRR